MVLQTNHSYFYVPRCFILFDYVGFIRPYQDIVERDLSTYVPKKKKNQTHYFP